MPFMRVRSSGSSGFKEATHSITPAHAPLFTQRRPRLISVEPGPISTNSARDRGLEAHRVPELITPVPRVRCLDYLVAAHRRDPAEAWWGKAYLVGGRLERGQHRVHEGRVECVGGPDLRERHAALPQHAREGGDGGCAPRGDRPDRKSVVS